MQERSVAEFSGTFSKIIGRMPNIMCSLKLRENIVPIFTKHRPVPSALSDEINAELDMMESKGVISRTSFSEWGSLIVTIIKQNSTRIFGDYKLTVNPASHDVRYPIPLIDNIFN